MAHEFYKKTFLSKRKLYQRNIILYFMEAVQQLPKLHMNCLYPI